MKRAFLLAILFCMGAVMPLRDVPIVANSHARMRARDNMESYTDGALITGLHGGVGFAGSYSDTGPGILDLDTMESYSDGTTLNGLNGGTGFPSGYVDKQGLFGVKALDTMESYTDGTTLNGLNGGTGFGGAYVDR